MDVLDLWLKFDEETDEEPSHEANTYLLRDGTCRVEWSHTGVGQVTEIEFETYPEAVAWYEANGYTDFSL